MARTHKKAKAGKNGQLNYLSPNYLHDFLNYHSSKLPSGQRERLLDYYYTLPLALGTEELLQHLGRLLQQFRDEETLLQGQDLSFMSEETRMRFTDELKRILDMKTPERDRYLSNHQEYRHLSVYSPLVEEALRILGLAVPSSRHEIKQAYRVLAKQMHPDQGGEEQSFTKLQRAYQIAMDHHV